MDPPLGGHEVGMRILRAIVNFIDPPKTDLNRALSDQERLDDKLHEGHWWSESQNAYQSQLPSSDAAFKRGYRP